MNLQNPRGTIAQLAFVVLLISPAFSAAQVPVDDEGNVIGNYEPAPQNQPVGEDGITLLSSTELQELVGPVALYPDDLLAIVLPASAYPLQIAAAARFLEAHKTDASLKPDPDWDDTVVALINYPEVIELLNADLDWTYRLGEAVVAQQTDVVAAVESFRDRAYASGNLKSDSYQTVSQDDGVIEISPVADDVIYVPYYEPERVVVYQSRPSYFYYPRPYPVYYYPYSSRYYSSGHYFDHGYFWGVTTAFSIGWLSDSLHVHHHSYHGHPYYGHSYRNRYWYRRPSISIYNHHYGRNTHVTVNRYSHGDRWRARDSRRVNLIREGYSRSENRSRNRVGNRSEIRSENRAGTQIAANRSARATSTRRRQHEPIRFRQRSGQRDGEAVASLRDTRPRTATTTTRVRNDTTRSGRSRDTRRESIEFRPRDTQRQPAVQQSRETRRQQPVQARETRRQQPAQARETRRQQPAQARETRRQQAVTPSRNSRQQPVRQVRQGREQTARRQAPARQERQRSETRSRESQPRQQQESRKRESSGRSESPRRRSESKSNRGRERNRR